MYFEDSMIVETLTLLLDIVPFLKMPSESTGSCSTDTEKQLEKVQTENERLLKEVSSLHRFYSHTSSMGLSEPVEHLKVGILKVW